jgi:HD-like signal output (HDOD) protein
VDKKRILFVDDEPSILDGLRRLLHKQRHKWEMEFAPGGEEALALLAERAFDVIVTDMRMPTMDGATLLGEVQKRQPAVVRIVLSGHAELEATMRAVPVAHQFLTKPCEREKLENVIERACALQALVDDPAIRRIVGRIHQLPSRPRVYADLLVALAREETTLADVAQIVERDLAMSAKLLQLVNSAFVRLSRRITRIEEAAGYVGINTIKHLALVLEVFQTGRARSEVGGLSLELLHRHSQLTASIAAELLADKREQEDAIVAGLLHDVGKLILANELPRQLQRAAARMRAEPCPQHVAEQALLGCTHAELGGYLLGIWGLPYPIVEAVANHHAPARVAQQRFDVLAAVHVADALAHEHLPPPVREARAAGPVLDPGYVEALGAAGELAGWRALAADRAALLTADEPQ